MGRERLLTEQGGPSRVKIHCKGCPVVPWSTELLNSWGLAFSTTNNTFPSSLFSYEDCGTLPIISIKQRFGGRGEGFRLLLISKKESGVAQLCPTLCNPMDYSLPGSSVHGISQARILEWTAISFSGGSSQPRDQTCISCIGRWILHHCATWEVLPK